ncbi:unnamed protein product, partial [marine sediment metagenome]
TISVTPKTAMMSQVAKKLKRNVTRGGMNIVQTARTKNATNSQNIDQLNFPFISSHLLRMFIYLSPCIPLS